VHALSNQAGSQRTFKLLFENCYCNAEGKRYIRRVSGTRVTERLLEAHLKSGLGYVQAWVVCKVYAPVKYTVCEVSHLIY